MSATFVITIKADTAGVSGNTSRVERDLEKVKQKALEVNKTIRQVFGIFAIREVVTGLYGLVDTYTTLRNKLNVVAKDQANLNGIMGATFKVAQETRSSWASTAQMFSRMAMNSKQLGVSQKDLIGFTKTLNQAIIVGGATSTEASAGLLQLSQGMASGALKGDELRAVLEQLPVVADVIAKKFGVTRGELRKLGTDGKITGRDIILAFQDSAKEIDEAFKKTVPTIGQSFEMIKNAATKFFGEAGTGSGVLSTLAQALKFVSENMDTIGKVILAVSQAFFSLMIIKTVISLVRALWVVLATNPLTAFVMAITTGILLLRQFGDQINTNIPIWTNVKGVFVSVGDVLRVLWTDFKKLISIIGEFLTDAWGELTKSVGAGIPTQGVETSLSSILGSIAWFIGTAVGLLLQFKEKGLEVFGGLAVSVGEAFINVGRAIAKVFEELINKIIEGINSISRTFLGAAPNVAKLQAAINDGEGKGLKGLDLLKHVRDQGGLGSSGPQISPVDLGFKNALEGSGDATLDLMSKGLEEAKAKGEEWKKSMLGWIQSVKERARDLGAKRVMDQKNGTVDGYVSTDPSDYQKVAGGKDKEHDKMIAELDRLLKKSNEIRKAEMEMAKAEKFLARGDVLAELSKRGITAATVLSDLHAELSSALYPLEDWTNKQLESAGIMHGTTEEYQRNKAVLEAMNELYDKGLIITDEVVKQIEKVVTETQASAASWERQKAILEALRAPQREYTANLAEAHKLQEDNKISAQELNLVIAQQTLAYIQSARAARDAQLEYKALSDPHMAGMEMGINAIKDQMMQAATAIRDGMLQMLTALEDFILTAVDTGKFQWETLVESILKSLDRIALKILEQWLAMQIFSTAFGVPMSAPGVPSLPGAIDGGAHATGGRYTVPGSGPPDSQRVFFDLTPGEHVDFTPPGTMPRNDNGNQHADYGNVIAQFTSGIIDAIKSAKSGGSGATNLSVHNHIDRSELVSAIDTREGEQAVINVIRKNPGAIRSLVQK